jgi:hypothetical protein
MKNFLDWAAKAIQETKFQQNAPSEVERKPSVTTPLEVLETVLGPPGEPEKDVDLHRTDQQTESAPPAATSEVVVAPKPDATWRSIEPASSISTDVQGDAKFSLRKAIIAPDIYTSPVDRDRAIDLRWVLRDIKSNRLKLFPLNESDLRDLIDMGLVEMRDDVPVLTSSGAAVVS